MKRRMVSGIWVVVVCLALMVPAFAHSGNANFAAEGYGNGGVGNGMGTQADGMNRGKSPQMTIQSIDTGAASNVTDHSVSVYGTGTGTQYLNGYDNRTDNTANRYRTQSDTDGGYRTLETTTSRNFDWSWLGLLGLFGLFGLRSRNPQHER